MEYNSVFGPERPITTPYDEHFYRTNYHSSNLFFGSSLTSLCDLAEEKGYCFIGCNSNGNNAYFVQKDKMRDLKPLAVQQGFVASPFCESRDEKGELTYVSGEERVQLIAGLTVYNTRKRANEEL